MKKNKIFKNVLALGLVVSTLAVGFTSFAKDENVIKIGVSPTPHGDIAKVAEKVLEKEGYKLDIKEIDDYVTPNTALDEGELDANYFQHYPYLENFNKENNTKISPIGTVHIEPMGIYSEKYKSLDELKDGDEVVIPNDATNGARALKLLEKNGLIKLDPKAGVEATEKDITDNPKNLKIVPAEAASIPSLYSDAGLGVINSNYALDAGLNPVKDSLAIESEDNPYANVIAVKEGEEQDPKFKALLKAFQSDEVKKYIEDEFSGSIIPAFSSIYDGTFDTSKFGITNENSNSNENKDNVEKEDSSNK
ncbi:MAG: MetQ/NlpA family ABC transporter substrate-binding protein [Peptoniphilaceae bacterium]|nr:MetQ/NlpA family ABC transporter substrate-binding protein [Peptoniphilaceae bacterium]MDD7383691.1 MetQ/NlpA family ABC transporter substrate-binding protein [Peptoniphilaceae bacterium]MDY3738788.1 MetQ/NlpA family ABC transporter substrate-binding protein [Peptoniphilaceae bacterium]